MSVDDGREVLEVGPAPARNRRVLLVLAAVVVLALLAFTVSDRLSRQSAPPVPPPSPAPTLERSPTPTPSAEPTTDAPRVVRRGTGPLVAGLPAGRLYVRTETELFVVDPRSGRVVRTGGIELGTTGPVAMVPVGGGILLRPYDTVPAVLVPDGRPRRPPPGLLGTANEALPGPDGRVWVDRTDQRNGLTLVDGRGRPVGTTVGTTSGSLFADGRGGLLLTDNGGVWQAYPGPLRRITIGQVVGTGLRHYRFLECDGVHRCADFRYDRSTRARTRLGDIPAGDLFGGSLSPRGAYAVTARYDNGGSAVLQVEQLDRRVVVRRFPGSIDGFSGEPPVAWLTDRWVALLTNGRLNLYDPGTDRVVEPRLPISGAVQLVWAPA